MNTAYWRQRAAQISTVFLIGSVVIVLGGSDPASAVDTDIAISTSAIDFGTVFAGDTGPAQVVTLTNTGGDPFGPINIFGGAPPTAEYNASQNCQGNTLAAGGSCTVSFTFTPTGAGNFNDTSSFTISETSSQIDGEDFSVSLTGVGLAPISATPLSHDFGDINVGNVSLPLNTTITNDSNSPYGPINIFGGAPPTAEYNASQSCQGATLAPGAACTVSYTFAPQGPGVATDTSSFTISDTASQSDGYDFSVSLTGNGVNPITVVPLSHDFGEVAVGTTTAPLQTVVTNTSLDPFGPLTIFGGAPPTAEFNASQSCQGATLPPGGSCTIGYTFSPSSAAVFNDVSSFTLSATSSQQAGEDFSVSLAGCGQPCPAPTSSTSSTTTTPTSTSTTTSTTASPGTVAPVTVAATSTTTNPASAAPAASTTTTTPGIGGALPSTGGSAAETVRWAAIGLVTGAALLFAARRRTRT